MAVALLLASINGCAGGYAYVELGRGAYRKAASTAAPGGHAVEKRGTADFLCAVVPQAVVYIDL